MFLLVLGSSWLLLEPESVNLNVCVAVFCREGCGFLCLLSGDLSYQKSDGEWRGVRESSTIANTGG